MHVKSTRSGKLERFQPGPHSALTAFTCKPNWVGKGLPLSTAGMRAWVLWEWRSRTLICTGTYGFRVMQSQFTWESISLWSHGLHFSSSPRILRIVETGKNSHSQNYFATRMRSIEFFTAYHNFMSLCTDRYVIAPDCLICYKRIQYRPMLQICIDQYYIRIEGARFNRKFWYVQM